MSDEAFHQKQLSKATTIWNGSPKTSDVTRDLSDEEESAINDEPSDNDVRRGEEIKKQQDEIRQAEDPERWDGQS